MDFEKIEPFDIQLGKLLVFIIMFEKKIQVLRKKLAGNEEFHTRLVFQRMDVSKKGEIRPQDILYIIGQNRKGLNITNCQNFCRKHSVSGALSYDELLNVLAPKTDKILAQRLLVRTVKRGASLPNYLWKYFCQMFTDMIRMTKVTENIRQSIQNTTELNHLDMVQFFRKCLLNPQRLWSFCNQNFSEYDFDIKDVIYLSNHIRTHNLLGEMTDEDIKQIICPIDMNFQKTVNQMTGYYQNLKYEKKKTVSGGFYQPKRTENQGYKTLPIDTNFLNKTYTRNFKDQMQKNTFYQEQPQSKENKYIQNNTKEQIPYYRPDPIFERSSLSNNHMYLDNFIKPSNASSARQIDLDRFILNRSSQQPAQRDSYGENVIRNTRGGYQKFEDDLGDNMASDVDQSSSAFAVY